MSRNDKDWALEGNILVLAILFMLLGFILAYGIIVMVIAAILAARKTIQMGKAKSIGTSFLTIILVIGLVFMVSLLFSDTSRKLLPLYQVIILGVVFLAILLWGLYRKGWISTNKPFLKIWDWYNSRSYPDWFPHMFFNDKMRETKAMSFEDLCAKHQLYYC